MIYVLLARCVLVIHLLFILCVAVGGLLLFRWKKLAILHVPVALWGAGIVFLSAPCPLTPLEKWLLSRANYPAYGGSFIEHYLLSAIYPGGLTRPVELLLGFVVLGINIPIYWYLFVRQS